MIEESYTATQSGMTTARTENGNENQDSDDKQVIITKQPNFNLNKGVNFMDKSDPMVIGNEIEEEEYHAKLANSTRHMSKKEKLESMGAVPLAGISDPNKLAEQDWIPENDDGEVSMTSSQKQQPAHLLISTPEMAKELQEKSIRMQNNNNNNNNQNQNKDDILVETEDEESSSGSNSSSDSGSIEEVIDENYKENPSSNNLHQNLNDNQHHENNNNHLYDSPNDNPAVEQNYIISPSNDNNPPRDQHLYDQAYENQATELEAAAVHTESSSSSESPEPVEVQPETLLDKVAPINADALSTSSASRSTNILENNPYQSREGEVNQAIWWGFWRNF